MEVSKMTVNLSEFNVDQYGLICDPGKFEREPLYIPYYWDLFLDGCADFEDDYIKFEITIEDVKKFPELEDDLNKFIYLWSDSNGFIYHCFYDD